MFEVIFFPTSVTKYAIVPSRFKQHLSNIIWVLWVIWGSDQAAILVHFTTVKGHPLKGQEMGAGNRGRIIVKLNLTPLTTLVGNTTHGD